MENNQLDRIQKFTQRLDRMPDGPAIEKTPDGKAQTVVISHIEMTLDELFVGQWSTENFRWSAIGNEVQGAIDLVVHHPVTGNKITRTGAASVVITVDKVPDDIRDNQQERNRWALDPANKKPNALDLSFPKLKSECLKNAAQSLGKIFGRDLNRKNKDTFTPFRISTLSTGLNALPESTMSKILEDIVNGVDEFDIRSKLEVVQDLISDEQKKIIDDHLKKRP